jgi:hypothetical protein
MDVTNISDLPNNITIEISENSLSPEFNQSQYIPMNVHPNPYGISAQNPIMPLPQQPDQQQLGQLALQQHCCYQAANPWTTNPRW